MKNETSPRRLDWSCCSSTALEASPSASFQSSKAPLAMARFLDSLFKQDLSYSNLYKMNI